MALYQDVGLKKLIINFFVVFSKLAERIEKLLQLVMVRVYSKSQMHGVIRKWRHAICDSLSPETLVTSFKDHHSYEL